MGVFRTHANAPRVLLANSNLVPHWATWKHFNELDRKGLMMYGQMTAGSWIYIGSQGIVQGTYETFVEMGRRHYGGSLMGKWILTAGLGGMGGAQTLAATMAGASCLAIECRQTSIDFRLRTGYVDVAAKNLDEAPKILEDAKTTGKAVPVALLGNAADVLPELVKRLISSAFPTDDYQSYREVNAFMARALMRFRKPDAAFWIQDYHFLALGAEMRDLGVSNPIGFFLHTPWPARSVMECVPHHRELVEAMLAYDLIGFQTDNDRDNFADCLRSDLGLHVKNGIVTSRFGTSRLAAFPIGIDVDGFAAQAQARHRIRMCRGCGEACTASASRSASIASTIPRGWSIVSALSIACSKCSHP